MAAEIPTTESAKQRSLRVPLGHYRQATSLVGWKSTIAVLALLASGAYVAWLLLPTGAANEHLSPGPVIVKHAMWENDCAQCHPSFRPQRSDAVDLLSMVGKAGPAQDQACTKCHPGPPHHPNVKEDTYQSCSTCHNDHLGREANLVWTDDVHCTICHANLENHRSGPGVSPPIVNVTAFGLPGENGEGPHPKFRSLAADPGTVKFNHWLHLQPGVSLPDGKKQLKLADLQESERARYQRFADPSGLIQLDCTACHRLDPWEGPAAADTMASITFERNCQACHPLEAKLGSETAQTLSVPHGLSVARVTALVEGLIAEQERKSLPEPELPRDESGDLPLIPGRTLGRNLAQKISADTLARRRTVLAAIHVKCQQCHEVEEGASAKSSSGLPEIRRSSIPTTWLRHGRFAHSAHEHMQCRTCHQEAYAFEQRNKPRMLAHADVPLPAGYEIARDCDEVMIANLESCVACHAPKGKNGGGARHDCTECHRYHHAADVLAKLKVTQSAPVQNGGHDLAIDAPDASPYYVRRSPLEIRPVSLNGRGSLHLRPVALRANEPAVAIVGAASCAATGCHGDPRAGAKPYASAFHTWLLNDPHVRAYDVLWTYRGREMTRLLSGAPRDAAFNEEQHRRILAERCVGCHATPPAGTRVPGSAGGAQADASVAAVRDADYTLGVHCESCHGPATGWLVEHQQRRPEGTILPGQVQTKSLAARAGACVQCHVGPSLATGQPQPVDHDLIAAGHPRLNFDFHTYFESLPPHWDEKRDESAQSGAFHFSAWQAGMQKKSEQLASLVSFFKERSGTASVDFAALDCYACHHALSNDATRQHAARNRDLLAPVVTAGPAPSSDSPQAPPSPPQRLAAALALLRPGTDASAWSFDRSLAAYLGVRAALADLLPADATQAADLRAALADFARYLGSECFGLNRTVTAYDSPTRFRAAEAARHHEAVAKALEDFASSASQPRAN